MKNLTIAKTAQVSFTADQWELFDDEGREEAALALNAALQEAINAPGATAASAYQAMQPACNKYSHLGAADSEANNLIEDVIEKVFGE